MADRRAFCTVFDSAYLVRALALYRSLERYLGDRFEMTAYCFDDESLDLCRELALPRLIAVGVDELEADDPELRRVGPYRTRAEYFWTATPSTIRHALRTRPELDEITYIDADLLFFADPEPLFAEMGDASVLITPHRFAPLYARLERTGLFNVQYVTFRRTPEAVACLHWWRDRCLEWCYDRVEPGRYGDQKYLDEWPGRFSGVHVLGHPGGGVGLWNLPRHAVRRGRDGRLTVDGRPLVFVHFSGVRMRPDGRVDWRPGGYLLEPSARTLLLPPYAAALHAALAEVRALRPGFDRGTRRRRPRDVVVRAAMSGFTRARRLTMWPRPARP